MIDERNRNGIGMTSLRTRKRLVEQLQAEGIRNPDVLQAMLDVPRHCFIDEAMATRAYENIPLPIGYQQTISQPYVVARMTEALASGPLYKVLEIGTGSGYQAAVLAQLASDVYTIERVRALYEKASRTFRDLEVFNVHTRYGDGNDGWPELAPFDGIIVTAGAESVPETLLHQLADGGRMIIPVGPPSSQVLQLITRRGNDYQTVNLETVRFVPFKEGIE